MGRPSIDPELMIRMLVVGYCYDRSKASVQSRRARFIPESI